MIVSRLKFYILAKRKGESFFSSIVRLRQADQDCKCMEKGKHNPYITKGDKKQAINYRPISRTLVLIRLFKKIFKDKMIVFLDTNKLLTESQQKFRNDKICLFGFVNVYMSWNVGELYDVICFD